MLDKIQSRFKISSSIEILVMNMSTGVFYCIAEHEAICIYQ